MGLIDDNGAMLRQNINVAHRINGEQGVISDNDVHVLRAAASGLGETFLAVRATGGSDALRGRHGQLTPRLIRHPRLKIITVAGFRLICPLVDALDVAAEPGDIFFIDERFILLRIHRQFVQAQVIRAPLLNGKGRRAREQRVKRFDETRKIPLHQLPLQCQRGSGHNHRRIGGLRVADRGDEIGQRLTRTRASLHSKVTLIGEGLCHCLRHGHLPRTFRPAKGFHRSGEELLRAQ